jgi:DNA polymerase III alpha subunit (gram-positive type)
VKDYKFIQKYPRQTGRTTREMMEMFMFALENSGVQCVYVTHNHAFATQCMRKMQQVVASLFPPSGELTRENQVYLPNGSSIEFMSDQMCGGSEDRLHGRDIDYLVYDHVI